MDARERRHSPVYRQLEAYRESWQKDHEAAMACRDWEDAIAVGINILRMLREREQAWRDQVFRGAVPFDAEDDRDYQERFALWLDTTARVIRDTLPALEKQFGSVKGAEEFRRCARETEEVLLHWEAPRLTKAVGLREMDLSPESAASLDEQINRAAASPPAMPRRQMPTADASFFTRSS